MGNKKFWYELQNNLLKESSDWYDKNKDSLIDISIEEAKRLFNSLRSGNKIKAKFEIAKILLRDDRKAWINYQEKTINDLSDISRNRIQLLEAIDKLAISVAKVIGRQFLHAIAK